jgi:hypothetical protein
VEGRVKKNEKKRKITFSLRPVIFSFFFQRPFLKRERGEKGEKGEKEERRGCSLLN